MPLPKWATTVTPFSKTLALIIFITFPIVGFILGMDYQRIRTISHENIINILPTQTISSITQISPTLSLTDNETKILAEKICQNKMKLSLIGYENGEISKCGIYYGIYPPTNLMDAPIIIVDGKGNYITSCGGMPGPNGYGKENQSCKSECQKLNIKLCTESMACKQESESICINPLICPNNSDKCCQGLFAVIESKSNVTCQAPSVENSNKPRVNDLEQ